MELESVREENANFRRENADLLRENVDLRQENAELRQIRLETNQPLPADNKAAVASKDALSDMNDTTSLENSNLPSKPVVADDNPGDLCANPLIPIVNSINSTFGGSGNLKNNNHTADATCKKYCWFDCNFSS